MVKDDSRVVERLRRYVEIETPTGEAERIDTLARMLADDLEATGASVELVAQPGFGHHVRAEVAGREVDAAPIVLLGHLDTVHPVGTLAQRPFRRTGARIEGPGTFDMKAGLAVIVEALADLAGDRRRSHRPVRVLVSCDEEVGSDASRRWLETAAADAVAALVLEPSLPGGAAKTSRKGVLTFRVRARGRASHAGVDPERGVSAIAELAAQVGAMLAIASPDRGTIVNVGTIRGGTASNVVAAEAVAEVDVRFATAAEGERAQVALDALRPHLSGTTLEVERQGSRPPLERTPGVVALYEKARSVALELGFALGEGATGGGSDGSFLAALGVPTLDGLGPQGGGAHAVDEHVIADDLPRRAALLLRLLEKL